MKHRMWILLVLSVELSMCFYLPLGFTRTTENTTIKPTTTEESTTEDSTTDGRYTDKPTTVVNGEISRGENGAVVSCTPNLPYIDGCNRCNCTSYGTPGSCTMVACWD